VLLASEGVPNRQIALRLGASAPTVQLWRSRFEAGGVAALEIDKPGRGRPKVLGEEFTARVVSTVLRTPPPGCRTGASGSWRRRCRPAHRGAPGPARARPPAARTEGSSTALNPELEAKVTDVIGLYLHPPENATGALCR